MGCSLTRLTNTTMTFYKPIKGVPFQLVFSPITIHMLELATHINQRVAKCKLKHIPTVYLI